ncbi:MAG TPA: PilN domain-containing protein [Terriglobales bacterium]|nr:PilN domain-containing protein [Terriglobales bacterium]
MRLDINLATRPYEDAGQFWAKWGLGVGLLGLLTLVLVSFAIHGWVKAGQDRHAIQRLEDQIAERDAERAKAQAYLELDMNRSTRDQSQFLNSLIQRKAFSWTRVFEDLEKVVPPSLHVVSLKPELNDANQLELELKVAGDNRAAAIDLVHRMEGSTHFQGPKLVSESQGTEPGSAVSAVIQSIYVPETLRSAK